MAKRVINGLSVDVEDWFQVGAFEGVIDRSNWDGLLTGLSATVRRFWICLPRPT